MTLEEQSKIIMARITQCPCEEHAAQLVWTREDAETAICRSLEWAKQTASEERLQHLMDKMVFDFRFLAPEIKASRICPWLEAHMPWAVGDAEGFGSWGDRGWSDLARQTRKAGLVKCDDPGAKDWEEKVAEG